MRRRAASVPSRAGQDGEVAALARQIQPALIVLEVDSPRTAGKAVLRQLRANQSTCNIPVIAYISSAEGAEEPLEGFSVCLHESLMYDDFLAALECVEVTSPIKS